MNKKTSPSPDSVTHHRVAQRNPKNKLRWRRQGRSRKCTDGYRTLEQNCQEEKAALVELIPTDMTSRFGTYDTQNIPSSINKEKRAEDYANSIITSQRATTPPFAMGLVIPEVTMDHLRLTLCPHHSIWKKPIKYQNQIILCTIGGTNGIRTFSSISHQPLLRMLGGDYTLGLMLNPYKS